MISRDLNFPRLHQKVFTCPLCGIIAEHSWQIVFSLQLDTFYVSTCLHCKQYLMWKNEHILDPPLSLSASFHYMTPLCAQKFYLLAQQSLAYNLNVAYAYLQQAYYQLIVHCIDAANEPLLALNELKLQGVLSYQTCYDIERLGFLEHLSHDICINQELNLQLSEMQQGFELFNKLVEEVLAKPNQLVDFFAKHRQEEAVKIDPNFFEREASSINSDNNKENKY